MSNERRFESVYSKRVRAGKRRTYFFDVRKTRGDDFYLTLTESTRRFDGDGYERHKIFLYKEDFNRFLSNLTEAIDHVKTDLMPDYDYDEFTRRQEEYEAKLASGEIVRGESSTTNTNTSTTEESPAEEPATEESAPAEKPKGEDEEIEEDDMTW